MYIHIDMYMYIYRGHACQCIYAVVVVYLLQPFFFFFLLFFFFPPLGLRPNQPKQNKRAMLQRTQPPVSPLGEAYRNVPRRLRGDAPVEDRVL